MAESQHRFVVTITPPVQHAEYISRIEPVHFVFSHYQTKGAVGGGALYQGGFAVDEQLQQSELPSVTDTCAVLQIEVVVSGGGDD